MSGHKKKEIKMSDCKDQNTGIFSALTIGIFVFGKRVVGGGKRKKEESKNVTLRELSENCACGGSACCRGRVGEVTNENVFMWKKLSLARIL